MQRRSNTLSDLIVRLTHACAWLLWLNLACAADYLTPSDVVLPPERSSQEALDQSAGKASLRFLGLDLFPHAAVTSMYDDNILISSSNALSDVEWTISPGITVTAGDISSYLPGSVTLGDIRGMLNYSLLDDSSRAQRFLGVDYTPAVNFYTEHSHYNGVDHSQGLSAGYAFSRLAIGLDQDFFNGSVKDNQAGDLITQSILDTRLRIRYELTDRSNLEIKGQYHQIDYADNIYQGYEEFRNENWYDRRVGARLAVGLGAAFGLVYPEADPDQTYQQALVRGLYVVGGKLDLRANAGVEFRQYDSGAAGTVDPVFSLEAIYQPRATTRFTLEGHRKEEPSFAGDYNYTTLGFSGRARQLLLDRLYAQLTAGYDRVDYTPLNSGPSNDRADNYYSVGTSLQYEFNRHLETTLFWIYRQDASNINTYSYVDNMVGIRVYWHF